MEEVIGTKGLCLQEDIGTKVRKWNSFVYPFSTLCASNMLLAQSSKKRNLCAHKPLPRTWWVLGSLNE